MASEMKQSLYTDYVENCIKDIQKRSDQMLDRTREVQSELIRLVKERQNRDRSVIEDRFRSGVRNRHGNANCPAVFRPGSENLDVIKDVFGDIILSYENDFISFKTIKSFQCDKISNTSFMLPSGTSNVWISDDSSNLLQINSNGVVCKTLQINFPIEHAAIQGSDFIATSSEWLTVKRLRGNGTVKTEMSTSPLFPLGVNVTKEGDILVCLVDKFDFSITTKSRRLVMIYHHDSLIPTALEYDRGNRIFTVPNRVTSCLVNVVAIDVQSKSKSRVVCVNRESKVLFEYAKLGTKQFCPSDIVTTSNQEIFILDEATVSLFVLNAEGILISTLCLSDFCISQPTAISFDCSSDRLWIGHSINKITVFAIRDVNEGQSVREEIEDSEITNKDTEDTWF